MIIDTLRQAGQYTALHPLFEKAFKFLKENDLASLEPGKHPIDGENMWASIMHAPLKTVEVANLEVHDKYIDIQVVISGVETYGWIPRAACKLPKGEMNTEKDVLFFEDKSQTFVTLEAGQFAIFFPEDGHQPMIGEGEIRKCIIKVKA
jgi:YhcH/YjgK/YiaL family protein